MNRLTTFSLIIALVFALVAFGACASGGDDDDDRAAVPTDDDDDDLFPGDDDDDDDTGDDDTADDDTADDDTGDDDTGDDDTGDDDTPPAEVTVFPADGATDVPLNTYVQLVSDDVEFDPADIDFTLGVVGADVQGLEQFSLDHLTYTFYPGQLLVEGVTYEIHFTYDEADYMSTFTTIDSAGPITLTGNADAAAGEFYGWMVEPDDVLVPDGFGDLLLPFIAGWNFVLAPAFVGSDDKEIGFTYIGGGYAVDFNGDEDYEQDFASVGYVWPGYITGDYMLLAGSLDIEVYGYTIPIDLFFGTAMVGDDGGDPILEDGYLGGATHDCDALIDAFPYLEPIINGFCQEETGIYAAGTFHGTFNPLPDVTVEMVAIGPDGLDIEFDPGLPSYDGTVNPLNFLVELWDGDGELIFSSGDDVEYFDGFSFPDCCTEVGPNHYTFTELHYDWPETVVMTPGDYTMRFVAGSYGVQENFNVPETE